MLTSRQSEAKQSNERLSNVPRISKKESNSKWVSRVLGEKNLRGWILLIGGTDLTNFRIRIAQSQARMDLLPSYWSHVALIGDRIEGTKPDKQDWSLYEVRLDPKNGFGNVPKYNGVQEGKLTHYDNPERFPNIACFNFFIDFELLMEALKSFRSQRSLIDIGSLIVEWLGFVWGIGQQGNPLLKGVGIPSAAFVEAVFALANLDLTPGLSTTSSCPEAIWQSAKWWYEFYKSEAVQAGAHPEGFYFTGQPYAAVLE